MCDVNGPFKLCTCNSKVDGTKPHWILNRYIQSKKEFEVMGDFKLPDPYQKITTLNLISRLNSVNVFDFEYQPVEGDYLKLFLSPKSNLHFEEDEEDFVEELHPDYILEFMKGKWVLLGPWDLNSHKHSISQSGEIIGPKTDLTIAFEKFKQNATPEQLVDFEFLNIDPNISSLGPSQKRLMEFFKKNLAE